METTLISWLTLWWCVMDVGASTRVASGVLEALEGGARFEWFMDVEERQEGAEKIFEEQYLNEEKKVVVIEKTRMLHGRFLSSESHHLQLGAEASILVEQDSVHFRYTRDGVVKTNQEPLTPNFVTHASMLPYLQQHLEALKKGETIPVRFAIPERLETIAFDFKKKAILPSGDIELKMVPSFFLIALFAPSFDFTLTEDGSFVKTFQGIGLPRTGHPGAWKLTQFRTTYQKL
jgi:hypothetical protein